ncbi:MAG: lipopolysaccharide biosynthesis protein, partial [Sulfitobacter sp.]
MAEYENITVSKRLVAINSASSVLAKIVNMTVLLWVYQYLLKRIPTEEFAVLPVVTAIMVFAPLFFSFFTGGISRYVVEAYAKGDFGRVARIISSIFPPLVVGALVFCVVGIGFALNIEKILNIAPQMIEDTKVMMGLLVVSFAFQMLSLPFVVGFNVRQRFVELNLLGIGRDLIRIMLLLTLLIGIGPQVIWVVVATFVSECVYTIVTVIRSRQMVAELRFNATLFEKKQAIELMSFGLWTTLGRLGGVMYTNAATIILNLYGSAVDVTNYHVGSTIFRQLDSMISLAAQPLQPAMTAMHALDDRTRLSGTVFRGGRYALWVAMSVATPLLIYADTFIDLYLGAKYSSASMVIVLFMIIFPFTKPTTLLAMTAMAMARVREFFLPAFLFQVAGLTLMILSVTQTNLGVLGVTLSLTIITAASQILYYWPLCQKLTDSKFRDFVAHVLRPGFSPALGAGIIWLTLKLIILPQSWLTLGLCVVSG